MQNKRGQGLSTNAIILIVLGVVVLVMLIVGFTAGWSTLAPWIKTNNVNTLVTACGVACSTSSVYDFCSVKRELKLDTKIEGLISGDDYTCNELLKFKTLGMSDDCSDLCPKETSSDTTSPETD